MDRGDNSQTGFRGADSIDLVDQPTTFEEMLEQNKGLLYKVVNMYCKNEDDKSDLLQEIKIQLWRSFGRYSSEYKLSTWIYRVSLNVAVSFHRNKRAQKNLTVPIEGHVITAKAIEDSEQETKLYLLGTFIDELNEFDKAVILLQLENTSHPGIADILGISVTNVSTKIARIKVKLKERFVAEGY